MLGDGMHIPWPASLIAHTCRTGNPCIAPERRAFAAAYSLPHHSCCSPALRLHGQPKDPRGKSVSRNAESMRSRPDRRHITALEIRASDLLPGKTSDSFQINGLRAWSTLFAAPRIHSWIADGSVGVQLDSDRLLLAREHSSQSAAQHVRSHRIKEPAPAVGRRSMDEASLRSARSPLRPSNASHHAAPAAAGTTLATHRCRWA